MFWNIIYFAAGVWFGLTFGEPLVKFIKAFIDGIKG